MTERRKDFLCLAALLALLVLFFSKILFTDRIVRAPDIINEFYWGVKSIASLPFLELFKVNLTNAGWDIYVNSGFTNEGGGAGGQFLFLHKLIFRLIPSPASVAWHMVFNLFVGGAGTYCYCRLIGAGRSASFTGGLIFALAPENASLINAGHVMKIATICFAPWAFYFLEKGFQTRRLIFFMTTGFVLAFQFFHTHWQVAYYTCLGIGLYGVLRTAGILLRERQGGKKELLRLAGLNLAVMLFFLSTVAIALAPLANWSKDTNRGTYSGANQGKGGLEREEAMSWSLPPEEIATFIIPGMFGLSRQEAGENPSNITSYYWGRMHFTQTTDYMGLLPWLLLPLPLIFRRDRFTWIAVVAVAGGIVFSMGKYTFIYNLLYDYFPGINRFRVPKMIMFLPVLGLGVLSARGLDLLLDEKVRQSAAFRRYLYGLFALPALLLVLLGVEKAGENFWVTSFFEMLVQPTRYEQGAHLVTQRWDNLVVETGIAFVVALLYAAAVFGCRQKVISIRMIPFVLLFLYVADVGRINSKFMFLVDEPYKEVRSKTPVMEFLGRESNQYRVLPMNGSDPMLYAGNRIPVMFTSNPVMQRRWQEFLDAFNLGSAMPDLMNVKYLIYSRDQYEQQKAAFGNKYVPVLHSPDGREVVLENRGVLPKAWLVPSVIVVNDYRQSLSMMQNPAFVPRRLAVVESPPPFPMAPSDQPVSVPPGEVRVAHYEGERIKVAADVDRNALLVLGEKYYRGWKAAVDGKPAEIHPVNHVLRGVYLTPGRHEVELFFDPLPFKVGKYLTLVSFVIFAAAIVWELRRRRQATRA